MRDFDSNRIYEILGEEFKNIYIVDCKTQQIHAFKETDVLPGFSAHMLYNDAMNQYIDHCVYEKNRDMLRIALSFNSLYTRLENAEHFNIHYQSKTDSEIHFMYTHFGCIKDHDKITQIVIGFANEDLDIRRNNLDMINNVITPSGLRRKILIVEDNDLNREMLKATLEDEYDVLEAVNGEDGLQILSQNYKDISIVLLDVVMPVCDGFEFLTRQKSDSLLASVPVIVTTGNNSQEDELKCLGLGAVDFITKPYNTRIVMSRIDSVIKLRESSMTLAAIEKDELTGLYTRQAFYHRASHCKYLVQYHIIWCPKFRCDGMDETLKKILSEVCDAYGYIIKALEVMPDHIHIFVDCPATVAPCDVVRTLKSMSAIQLFKAYPELKRFYARCGKLWSNGYFISSVGHISEAAIRKYIEEQKNDTTRIESLS